MTERPNTTLGAWWHRLLCLWHHDWQFYHGANPPVVTCARCGRTDPMPYGDARMPYL